MSFSETAYSRLRTLILSGQLPPDSVITENAMVARLALGKTPVREAMRRLVLEGLLDVTPRLGYTVSGISQQDVNDIFQLRVIVEVAAAQLAVDHMTAEALERLQALSTSGYDPDDPDSMQRYLAENAEYHDIIGTLSGNRRLADLIRRLMLESRRFVQIAHLTRAHGEEVVLQHVAIVGAFRAGDRDAVGDAVRVHVEDAWRLMLYSLAAGSGEVSVGGRA